MTAVPEIRIRSCNSAPVRGDGQYVLYWMIAFRRLGWNFALERAAEQARELGKAAGHPGASALRLSVGERPLPPLRAGRHGRTGAASRGLERPLLPLCRAGARGRQGAPRRSRRAGVPGGDRRLRRLSSIPGWCARRRRACRSASKRSTRTASFRCAPWTALRHRRTTSAARSRSCCRITWGTCRRKIRWPKSSRARLKALPAEILRRWPAASAELLRGDAAALAALPIDHRRRAGRRASRAARRPAEPGARQLPLRAAGAYGEGRNDPERGRDEHPLPLSPLRQRLARTTSSRPSPPASAGRPSGCRRAPTARARGGGG